MTTDNFEPEPLKKPDDIDDGSQLPDSQRHYLNAAEVGKYRAQGYRIYIGKRKGTYIDATEQVRDVPFNFVDLKEKWVRDFIAFDPDTKKPRLVADPFEITAEDENSGEMVKLSIEGLYHVPNHGPNTFLYEDNVERLAGKTYKDEKGDKIAVKKNANGQPIVTTRKAALVLNGDRTIPATAQEGSV